MDFSQALIELKNGNKVCRSGWNGKGMWLYLIKQWGCIGDVPVGNIKSVPFIAIKTTQDTLVPWFASQEDLLARDWEIL